MSAETSAQEAQLLLGRIIHPRFLRALFGLDEVSEQLDDESVRADFDLDPVRKAVADSIRSIEGREIIEKGGRPSFMGRR